MRGIARLMVVVAVVGFFAAGLQVSAADEVTLTGNIVCAKCSLKVAGLEKCQNVLVVKGESGDEYYYLASSPAAEKFGHVCAATKSAVVTGTVAEKDGKKWLTASTIKESAEPKKA